MFSIKKLVVPVIMAIAIVFSLSSVKGEDVQAQELLCKSKGNDIGPVKIGLVPQPDFVYLITKLIVETPTNGYSQHHHFNDYYGVAACNGHISKEECYHCLNFANNELFQFCGLSNGGQIKLVECKLRFENYEFFDW